MVSEELSSGIKEFGKIADYIHNKANRAITRFERTANYVYDKYIGQTIDNMYNLTDKRAIDKAIKLAGIMIGQSFDYNSIAEAIIGLGRDTESILGKQFPHIYRNMGMGLDKADDPNQIIGDCPFFNFYGGVPTIRLADPYSDSLKRNKYDLLYYFEGNTTLYHNNLNLSYAESEDGLENHHEVTNQTTNGGSYRPNHESFSDYSTRYCDLIKKTNILFKRGELQTLIGRFHTNTFDSKSQDNATQTANTNQYGMSHGRNLLKLEVTDDNTYDNPYCRVWTYHHQYHTIMDLIRPFGNKDKIFNNSDLDKEYGWDAFRSSAGIGSQRKVDIQGTNIKRDKDEAIDNLTGGARLDKYGVLNHNGFVNIAPTAKITDYFDRKIDTDPNIVDVKKTMFSIENLAWKDFSGNKFHEFDPERLSAEQRGPFGGRIMWFPPYGLTFNENVSVNWNEHSFIGRGEKIYTYSNTDRSGNLSFQLLIDHPAILDYWMGRSTNMNKGIDGRTITLAKGNTGGVDNIANEENTILRFFAGCDVLSASKQRYPAQPTPPKPKEEKKEDPPVQPQPQPETPPEPPVKKIVCMLYYPNNYSGKDDWGSDVNPIDYLMNGVYAQKQVVVDDASGKLHEENIPTTDKHTLTANVGGIHRRVGGYEMRDIPISYNHVTGNTKPVISKMTQERGYSDKVEYAYQGEDGHGENKVTEVGIQGDRVASTGVYAIAKQTGSNARFSASVKLKKSGRVVPNDQWFYRKWFYRVDYKSEVAGDYDVTNQVLIGDGTNGGRYDHYIDKVSHQLNSNGGYLKTKEADPFKRGDSKEPSNSGETVDEQVWVSFADLYVAANEEAHKIILDGLYNEDNVKLVKKVLNEEDNLKIKDVEFIGHASLHGVNKTESKNVGRNRTLAKGRQETFAKFVNDNFKSTQGKSRLQDIKVEEGDKSLRTSTSVDDLTRKMWRSAEMIISYCEDTSPQQETQVVTEQITENTSIQKTVGTTELKNDGQTTNQKAEQEAIIGRHIIDDELGELLNVMEEVTVTANYYKTSKDSSIEWNDVNRYDNEGEFFKLLETKEPFLHNLISDKIKYFDPAFHSISPEGFNSRLTFLHQCTRQGPTRAASDSRGLTANNTAFGRPPVCILRIGDFYYTKIIIKSLNITYDPLQWDLNKEGIGVMPMIAKVDINFQFIGGSDLAGPIARLQNALSFNYYANAGVYDNRADQIAYDKMGGVIRYKAYDPDYDDYTKEELKSRGLMSDGIQ